MRIFFRSKRTGRKLFAIALIAIGFLTRRANAAAVSFEYFNNSIRAAHGVFTFNDSLVGQTIHYADLDSFYITFDSSLGGSTYDLAYVRAGGFSEYLYFGFNTSVNAFVATNINGFTTYLAAIKPGYVDGFWIGINNANRRLSGTDYAHGTQSFTITSSSIQAIPKPSLTIMSAGTNLVISWPSLSSTAGFRLQQNTDPAITNWMEIATVPTVTNGQNQVLISPDAGQMCYRLIGP